MTQEQKELLLKDLCARLPYKVNCEIIKRRIDGEMVYIRNGSSALTLTINNVKELVTNNLYEIKPYLFPLSSMTEEQEIEYDATFATIVYEDGKKDSVMTYKTFDWLNKNHFDYRDLIPMELAIDATELNIYKLCGK
jgi:hypothetical protein